MKSARNAAFAALVAIEKGRETRLDAVLDRRGMAQQDRAFALELARGVERQRIFLDAVTDALVEKPPRDPFVRSVLRLGAYQLLCLSRVPAYAAVGETVGLLRERRGFANAVLRRLASSIVERAADPALPRREIPLPDDRALCLAHDVLPDPETDFAAHHAVRQGLPTFLVERWSAAHGAATAARLAAAAARTPDVFLRAVRARGDAAALAAVLAGEGVTTEPTDHPALLRWTGGASPFAGSAFDDGWFAVQDPTALRAAEAVGAQPGEVVVDLCAGPGTKTCVLAEAVAPDGVVHAYDVSEQRRAPIRHAAARLGLGPLIAVHDDPATLPKARRVLVDVPCSNTGVLARRVEVRRRLRPEVFAELAAQQRELLRRAIELTARGGTVVYSTCSIEPEENDEVVAAVLAEVDATVERSETTLPDPPRHDGGFVAVIRLGR